jgi:hypothetical protein
VYDAAAGPSSSLSARVYTQRAVSTPARTPLLFYYDGRYAGETQKNYIKNVFIYTAHKFMFGARVYNFKSDACRFGVVGD